MHQYSDRLPAQAERSRDAGSRAPSPAAMVAVARREAVPGDVVELQRTVGNAAVVQLLADEEAAGAPSPVLDVVGRGGGQSLEPGLRTGMEAALGADLGDVRVHTDGQAAASAQAVQAQAYTVGDDVVFGPGKYQPGSPEGQRTLAHELTHVVQQRQGPVAGTPTGDGIALSDPSDSFERAAESNAERITSGAGGAGPVPAPDGAGTGTGTGTGPVPGPDGTVQRQGGTDELAEEEPVQGLWVQRAAAVPAEDEDQST